MYIVMYLSRPVCGIADAPNHIKSEDILDIVVEMLNRGDVPQRNRDYFTIHSIPVYHNIDYGA